ncbi:lamin tail domain-containing protein [Candidatus Berkelbacteria bacterium]|nr:lamin tail domain-containing protein [Candidatus Berkelbacteria bacterium]
MRIRNLIVLLIGFCLIPTIGLAFELRDVVINEINWAGSPKSTADEWLELRNLTTQEIDLSGWKLVGAATSGGTLTIPSGKKIAAQDFFLITNFADTDTRSTLNVAADWQTSSLSLPNSNAKYVLLDNTNNQIDAADDGVGAPFAGSITPKASMERNRSIASGETQSSWHTSYQFINFDPPASGSVQFGSPKAPNNALPVIALGRVSPKTTASSTENSFTVDYDITDPDGPSDITSMRLDLTDLGAELYTLPTQSATAKYIINPPSTGMRHWNIKVTDAFGAVAVSNQTLSVFQNGASVHLSEIIPKPQEGSDFEWIELYNEASHLVDLSGYQLDDVENSGSSPYVFPAGTTIGATSYLVVEKSEHKIALNDSGDVIRLLGPDGYQIETTPNWGKAKSGQAFANLNGAWAWTTVATKGAANQPSPPAPVVQTVTSEQAVTAPAAPPPAPPPTEEIVPEKPKRIEAPPKQEVTVATPPPSQKIVKGIKITKTAEMPQPVNPVRPLAIPGAFLFVHESLMLWSRRQKLKSKQYRSADALAKP